MKKIFLSISIFILFIILSPIASAATPELLFSDLTDGTVTGWNGGNQKGAAVSIWGYGFGSSRGSSYVTVGGVNLTNNSDYAEWGATTNPTTANGQERITFWLKPSMTLGDTTITVTTSEGTSTSIPFYTRNTGNIYFVSPSGNDSNTGLNDSNQMWATFSKSKASINAGDVVYFRNGTWTDYEYEGSFSTILFYNGVNYAGYEYQNGTTHNSITFSSYPGESAKIGDGSTAFFIRHYAGAMRFWTFSKFDLNLYDDVLMSNYDCTEDSLRFVGLQYTSTAATAGHGYSFNGYANGTDFKIYGCYSYNCGGGEYGSPMYFGGGQSQLIDIGWNEFTGSHRQIQFFGHRVTDRVEVVRVHDNFIHHNHRVSIMMSGGDPTPGDPYTFVANGYIYNNIIAHNLGELRVADGSPGTHGNLYIYNNTLYNNALSGTAVELAAAAPDFLEFKDNIVYAKVGGYFNGASENITATNNCWFGKGNGPAWDTTNFDDTDPQFVIANPINYQDFQIKDTSPLHGQNIGARILGGQPQNNHRADVNNSGTINIFDANLTFQKALGLDMSGTGWINNTNTGDANCNNSTNIFDANLIFKHSLGLDVSGEGWCVN